MAAADFAVAAAAAGKGTEIFGSCLDRFLADAKFPTARAFGGNIISSWLIRMLLLELFLLLLLLLFLFVLPLLR